ncbi:MAG: nitroreductase [Steroidobacter sp.]
MDVSTAIDSRMSCRAFLDTSIARETIVSILETAKRAPSGGNLQPWMVHVLTGAPLAEFVSIIRGKLRTQPMGEGAEYNVYPPNLHDPYRSRRFRCGEDLYATINIARENKLARLQQFARNYEFFGAPVALFFAVDRRMGADQWADLGMFMQNIMLLAREQGLHTCAQEAWAVWHRTVGEFLRLPAEQMLFCGMALGYRDENAPINSLRTDRAALEEFATLRGFD